MNPIIYLRALWLLFRSWRNRRGFVWPGYAGHFIVCDGRPAYGRPALCGAMIDTCGSATTQTSIVKCWRCAVAIARDPGLRPRRARVCWETYPDGTTVCRSCGHSLSMPPGCSCPATFAQRLERFLTYQAENLKFRRLRAEPQAWIPWDEDPSNAQLVKSAE